jgi:hypothetical protein
LDEITLYITVFIIICIFGFLGWIIWNDPLSKAEQDAEEIASLTEDISSNGLMNVNIRFTAEATAKIESSDWQSPVVTWELEHCIPIALTPDLDGKMQAFVIPPYDLDVIAKSRLSFEKSARPVNPTKIDEWLAYCRFSNFYQLVTMEKTEGGFSMYTWKYKNADQLRVKVGGGFEIENVDDVPTEVVNLRPSYNTLAPLTTKRYTHLFSIDDEPQ